MLRREIADRRRPCAVGGDGPLLFGPSPGPVSPAVLAAQARPLIDPTHDDFSALFYQVADHIRELCRAPGYRVVIQNSTATGAIEGALLNLTRSGDQVIVLVNGQLSNRTALVAERLGLDVRRVDLPWGCSDIDQWRLRASVTADARLLLAVHHETSTGALLDPGTLVGATIGTSALLALDATSSVGAVPVRCADWGVDVLVASSQKGLGATPGLALTLVSDRALARVTTQGPRTYALDWTRFVRDCDLGHPGSTFTPAISLMFGLARALQELRARPSEQRHSDQGTVRRLLIDGLVERGFNVRLLTGYTTTGPVAQEEV